MICFEAIGFATHPVPNIIPEQGLVVWHKVVFGSAPDGVLIVPGGIGWFFGTGKDKFHAVSGKVFEVGKYGVKNVKVHNPDGALFTRHGGQGWQ